MQESLALQDALVEHRRYIHKNAEISDDLPVTAAYVKSELKNMGYEPKEISKSGIVAIAGKKKGKTILLRADMDALPITEENDLEFKAASGHMHACGHDMHTAMLLGAAKLLKSREDELQGQVKLMFQPGEETMVGAKAMVGAGVLKAPDVDAAFMLHVMTGFPVPLGLVIVPQGGTSSASSDWFKITAKGKGGHGAAPNNTIDPLNMISHIHLALQAVNAREIAPEDTIAFTAGQLHGGETSNVIPDSAFLSGTLRTFSAEVREFVKKRIEEISKGIATAFRGSADVEFGGRCPGFIVDQKLRDQFVEYTSELLGGRRVKAMKEALGVSRLTGTEDFAFVSEKVPSVIAMMGAGSPDDGHSFPPHHPKATFDEEVLSTGAAVYANMAINWLMHNK